MVAREDERGREVRARLLSAAVALTVGALTTGVSSAGATSASWHLDSSFGDRGVAGLPLREEGIDFLYPPGPGDRGSLLAGGPQGSVFVGGYADSERGSFLVARMSAQGRLLRGFGSGGVSTVAGIYSTPQQPPRMFSLAGGRLLIVGLDRAHDLVAARLTAHGRADRSFGHDGFVRYRLAGTHGHAIVAAAALESGGDLLVACFPKEAPQPINEPRIAPGLGEGALELVRLTPSGALDRSFGRGGFLTTTGQPPAVGEGLAAGVTIAPDGSILLAYEQASMPPGDFSDSPAVQQLTPAGVDDPSFGDGGVALLPYQPRLQGEDSSIFDGLFALPGGGVEVSFGGGGELFRFTPAGAPDAAFGVSGRTSVGPPFTVGVIALAIAPDGETFLAESGLTAAGALASGAPDPALGGKRGRHFAANLPARAPGQEQQALELLPGQDSLSILIGEDLVRIVE
jgi:uncharacterized delta-60 repeat protein